LLLFEAGRQLDEAVKVGKSYAENDPETLVIVTADHETGSLAIEDTNEIQSDPECPNETGKGRTEEDGPFRVANSDKKGRTEGHESDTAARSRDLNVGANRGGPKVPFCRRAGGEALRL